MMIEIAEDSCGCSCVGCGRWTHYCERCRRGASEATDTTAADLVPILAVRRPFRRRFVCLSIRSLKCVKTKLSHAKCCV